VLDRARRALDEFRVEGIATTIGFHRWLLDTPDFIRGDVHTSWLEENWPGMRVQ
jgi:biotin carboxylase